MRYDVTNLNDWAIGESLYKWIRENLEDGKTILELGSGTGTVELTKHYKVYSVEDKKEWCDFAKESNYFYAPIVKYKDYDWYHIDIFKTIPKDYDLLIIDGPSGCRRTEGFIANINLFKTDIPIIIDDTEAFKLWNIKIVDFLSELLGRKVITIQDGTKMFSVILKNEEK